MIPNHRAVPAIWAWPLCVVLVAPQGCAPQKATMRDRGDSVATKQESSAGSDVCLNIVGGQGTDGFPAVYRISYNLDGKNWYACTGTFVSDNTLITAAHCMPLSGLASDLQLDGNQLAPSDDQTVSVSALQISYPSHCGPSPLNEGRRACDNVGDDLAIVRFPDRTASQWLPVATTSMPLKTLVTVVGYGQTSLELSPSTPPTDGDAFRKKFGFNALTTPPATIPTLYKSGPEAEGTNSYTITGWRRDGEAAARGLDTAVPAKGDSGGPLIAKDFVIGVSSTAFALDQTSPDDNFNVIAGYTSLVGKTAKQLMDEATASGARITFSSRTEPSPPPEPTKEPDDTQHPTATERPKAAPRCPSH